MKRREFLVRLGAVTVVLPVAGHVLVGCGDSDADVTPDTTPQGSRTFESTMVDGHTHTFTITEAALQNPPSNGIQENTSLVDGHVHVVTLSQAELDAIDGGQTITKSTSLVDGHIHEFTFSRAITTPETIPNNNNGNRPTEGGGGPYFEPEG